MSNPEPKRRRKPTIEDVSDKIRIHEETIMMHTGHFAKNSCEARIIVTVELPDGRVFSTNRMVRLRLTEVRNA